MSFDLCSAGDTSKHWDLELLPGSLGGSFLFLEAAGHTEDYSRKALGKNV